MGGYYRPSRRTSRSGHERMLELLLRRGDIEAQGALGGADVWGRLAGQIGDIGAGAVQQYGDQQAAKRKEDYQLGVDAERRAREAAVDARAEAQSRREAARDARDAEEAERKKAERAAIDAAIAKAQGRAPAQPTAPQGTVPQAAPQAQSSGIDIEAIARTLPGHMQADFRKSAAEANTAALKFRQSQDDYFARLALGVQPFVNDPAQAAAAVEIALRHAEEAGVQGVDAYRQQIAADPSKLPSILQGLIDRSPEVSKEVRGKRHMVTTYGQDGRPIQRLATEDELAKGVPAYREPKTAPKPNLERIETIDPATGKAVVKFVEPKAGDSYAKPTGAARPSTGQQRKALNFFNRGKEAHELASALEEAGKVNPTSIKVAGKVPLGAGNLALSDDNQKYLQAQRAFTEARLRKESGATVKDNEYEQDAITYFEQPGDSPAVKAQKRAGRNAILAGIAFETGDALKEFYGDEADGMLEGYRTRTNLKGSGAPSRYERLDDEKGGKPSGRRWTQVR